MSRGGVTEILFIIYAIVRSYERRGGGLIFL